MKRLQRISALTFTLPIPIGGQRSNMLYKNISRRKIFSFVLIGSVFSVLSACTPISQSVKQQIDTPDSNAAVRALYGYVPVDPLPLQSVTSKETCDEGATNDDWLEPRDSLPDNAVRVAVRDISGNGELSVLSNDIGVEGRIYQVVIDYMNSDVANEDIYIAQYDINGDQVPIDREGDVSSTYRISSTYRKKIGETDIDVLNPHTRQFTVPVFVGTGLRMTANVRILKGSVNLTSIGAIALAAEAGRIEGSLVVQTLGIAGQQVAGLLPLPSELNTTTVQNAIVALGSIKAVMYDEETLVTPRVLGFYQSYNISNPRIVNAMVTSMAKTRPTWWRSCHNS